MLNKLYPYRFEFFLITQLAILFGSLIIPSSIFEVLSQLLFFLNILVGSLFLGGHQKHRNWVIVIALFIIGGVFDLSTFGTLSN
jgi:hypothetical protein